MKPPLSNKPPPLLFRGRKLYNKPPSQPLISHFRVPSGLCFKMRCSAFQEMWKSFFILMQIKLVFTRKAVHLASFWKWGFLELGRGLLFFPNKWYTVFVCTDPEWFIYQLKVWIWFWSLAAWPTTSCTWAFPLCLIVRSGELIPSSFLN